MNKSLLFLIVSIILFTTILSGCQVVGAIFKTGFLSGVVIVVAVIALIAYLLSRGNRNTE